jgi:hypothetical protein
VLHFEDHEGQREIWIVFLELIKKAVPESVSLGDLDTAIMVDELGLCSAAASRHSLVKDDDHWLLRHYSHHPDGLPEVYGLWGGVKPFAVATLPASTDVAFEGRLNARNMPKMMRRLAKPVGSSYTVGSSYKVESALKEMLPIGLTLDGVLSQASMDVLLSLEVAKTGSKQMPVMPKAFVLKLRTEKVLVAACKPLLSNALGEAKTIPQIGALACTRSMADTEKGHEPPNHEDW